ncbi:unnamed protein product [Sphenostylis stenocarpa]|uniref:Uncharacterized protein n=1 Tax=Sphenostylis stenocarpa TaxID=92480 RepID=A0AA86W3E0_9FABA|nr:unnamed protein product [Sphenostylis stenocarpa]
MGHALLNLTIGYPEKRTEWIVVMSDSLESILREWKKIVGDGYLKDMLPGEKYWKWRNYVFMDVKHGDSEIN